MTDELVLHIARDVVLNANGRMHHLAKARRTKALRIFAAAHARAWGRAFDTPVRIVATIVYLRAGRHDASNYAPTVKALVDGCVDAGVLPEDHDRVVVETVFRADLARRAERPGCMTFRLAFEPVTKERPPMSEHAHLMGGPA